MPSADKPLGRSELQGPARDFSDFCEREFERRRSSDSPFDEALYREAMNLVIRKINRDSAPDAP
jgi:hypothetical protein